MLRIVVFVAVAAAVFARWNGEDIPGISPASMEKLRQIMTPRPASREEFRRKIHQWRSGLSETERAAAEAYKQQMLKKLRNSKQEK
ncbi:hypothetical protein ANCCAN_05685 [Ancylostoma caninum]|uniref:SXP/RAL-2 family protein Ani s 5-like cation-binding domain-containing protein n=1 Tax=Ancylostoma caninum TaxID=29170 RepID=A0A368GZ49_ANCCA|nr:hypothetical protein ANCCAN_05685 [Ancylostoma caninum]